MLNIFLLSVTILASPVHCAPHLGEMRWDDVKQRLNGDKVVIRGSIWDRDRNGRPSAGDIMRIDQASRGRVQLSVAETWIVLGRSLARELARKTRRPAAACETGFTAQGIPRVTSGRTLSKLIMKQHRRNQPSTRDLVEADMDGLAAKICQKRKNLSEPMLARLLERKARARHRRAHGRLVKRLAKRVARLKASECTHLDVDGTSEQGLTF